MSCSANDLKGHTMNKAWIAGAAVLAAWHFGGYTEVADTYTAHEVNIDQPSINVTLPTVETPEDTAPVKVKKDKRNKAGDVELPTEPVDLEATPDVDPDELIDAGFVSNPNDSGEILYPPDYDPGTDAELAAWHGETVQEPTNKPGKKGYDYASKPVEERVICDPNNGWFGMTYFEKDHILIEYNECNIRAHGGDDTDIEETYEHERAHAAGWKHFEGTPETNPAYYGGGEDPNWRDGV